MAGKLFTRDHNIGKHKDKQCEKHELPRRGHQELLKIYSILWIWEQIPITPMENIEQTTCVYLWFRAGMPYPNGSSTSHEVKKAKLLIFLLVVREHKICSPRASNFEVSPVGIFDLKI